MRVELPQGSRVLGIFACGSSYWTRTAQIETEQEDGSVISFFLKVRTSFSDLQVPSTHRMPMAGDPK